MEGQCFINNGLPVTRIECKYTCLYTVNAIGYITLLPVFQLCQFLGNPAFATMNVST